MKLKPDKKRLEEIQDVYRTLGLDSEEFRKYLVSLAAPSLEPPRPVVYIECGSTSELQGEFKDAGLESNPPRD